MPQPFRLASAVATLQIGLFVVRFRMRPGFRSPPICHVGQNLRGHQRSQYRSWPPSLPVLQTKYIKGLELHCTQSSLLATFLETLPISCFHCQKNKRLANYLLVYRYFLLTMELFLPLGRIRKHQHLAQCSLFCISRLPAIVHYFLNFGSLEIVVATACRSDWQSDLRPAPYMMVYHGNSQRDHFFAFFSRFSSSSRNSRLKQAAGIKDEG